MMYTVLCFTFIHLLIAGRVYDVPVYSLPSSPKSRLCLATRSVADRGCLSRIPDPDFDPSRIPDPTKPTKEEGENISWLSFYFVGKNFTKLFYVWTRKLTRNPESETGIRDSGNRKKPILDPEDKKSTGSRIRIRNTGYYAPNCCFFYSRRVHYRVFSEWVTRSLRKRRWARLTVKLQNWRRRETRPTRMIIWMTLLSSIHKVIFCAFKM